MAAAAVLPGEEISVPGNETEVPSPSTAKLLLSALYCLVFLTAVFANTFVSVVLGLFKFPQRPEYMLLSTLGLANTLVALVCVPTSLADTVVSGGWPLPEPSCPLAVFLQRLALFCQSLLLLSVGVERYLCHRDLEAPNFCPERCCRLLVMAVVLSALAASPSLAVSRVQLQGSRLLCVEVWPYPALQKAHGGLVVLLQFLVPVLVLVVMMARICTTTLMTPPPQDEQGRRVRRARKRTKVVKLMLVLALVYAWCWLPHHLLSVVWLLQPSVHSLPYFPLARQLCHWLGVATSCLVPAVVIAMEPVLRKVLSQFLHC